jgi:4-amino-4-deoxy-L-arabinose transferase-like glycosyltransferase
LNSSLLLSSINNRIWKKDIIPIIIIVGLAFFLRFWDLGWNGFNGDESIYSGQAASLLGEQDYLKNFAIFRAHPLFLQSMVSITFAIFGITDSTARLVPVIFGTLTVFFTYLVAKELFDRKVGLMSCLVLALLPFHIVFTRQVLVDIPLSFFLMLFLYFIIKYKITENTIYSYWTGVSSGLCLISKEIGIITIPIFVIFTLLTHKLKLNKFLIFLSGFLSGLFPYFFLIVTRQDAANAIYSYAIFQLGKGGHKFSPQYLSILINEAFGYALSILCIISVVVLWREATKTRDRRYKDQLILLVLTLGAFFIFYQFLPATGDRFMITLVPPAVILGCAFLVSDFTKRLPARKLLYILMVPLIILSTNVYLSKFFPIEDLYISDGLGSPWNRDAALWIKYNTPQDAGILTDNMPLANIIRFYSSHDVYAAAISPNPSYLQVDNPIFLILNNNASFIVQDLDPRRNFTKASLELSKFIEFSHPKLAYTAFKHDIEDGREIRIPMVRVYEVR